MRGRLQLTHKALILIAVPLVFEFIFIGVLTSLLRQAEHENFQERHSRAIVSESNNLLQSFMDTMVAVHMFASTKQPAFRQRYEDKIASLPRQVATLKVLLKDSPAQAQSMSRIERAVKSGTEMLSKANDLALGSTTLSNYLDVKEELGKVSADMIGELRNFVIEQEEAQRTDPQQGARTRLLIVRCLIGGVLINVLLATGLVIYFNRDTARRLRVLMENTILLAQAKPLNTPLSPGDEIGHLDSVFHDMADALKAAAHHKKQLIAIVSHDLRTPLTSVQASLTLLGAGIRGAISEEAKNEVFATEKNVSRLIRLITDLLDIEKMEAGKLQIVPAMSPMDEVFDEAICAVSAFAEESQVDLDVHPSGIEAWMDRDRVLQVIVNLLSNAIKFSPEGTTVSLGCEVQSDGVKVSICDQGRGIAESEVDRVFEPFHQVNSAAPARIAGTGLGLTICQAIVSGHGGEIAVTSEEGKGSTFWFTLPGEPINANAEVQIVSSKPG